MNNILTLHPPISLRFKLKFNLKLFWITLSILIITLLGLYIFQVNYLTYETYQLQNSQKKIDELSFENEILEIKLAKLTSLVNIETLIEKFNFEKANKIHYIQISESQIVKE